MKESLKSKLVHFAKDLDDYDGFGNHSYESLGLIKFNFLKQAFNELVKSKTWTKAYQEEKDAWLRQYNTLCDMIDTISGFLADNRSEINEIARASMIKHMVS